MYSVTVKAAVKRMRTYNGTDKKKEKKQISIGSRIHSPLLWDIVDSGIGLLHRPARQPM
jgi:hypothetical protein